MLAKTLWENIPPFLGEDSPEEEKWEIIRKYRDRLLKESDWTQLPDSPLTEDKRKVWAEYRAVLRDLPSKYEGKVDKTKFPNQPQ